MLEFKLLGCNFILRSIVEKILLTSDLMQKWLRKKKDLEEKFQVTRKNHERIIQKGKITRDKKAAHKTQANWIQKPLTVLNN